MARGKTKRAATFRNHAFGVAARDCHATTASASAYGKCVKETMNQIINSANASTAAAARTAGNKIKAKRAAKAKKR